MSISLTSRQRFPKNLSTCWVQQLPNAPGTGIPERMWTTGPVIASHRTFAAFSVGKLLWLATRFGQQKIWKKGALLAKTNTRRNWRLTLFVTPGKRVPEQVEGLTLQSHSKSTAKIATLSKLTTLDGHVDKMTMADGGGSEGPGRPGNQVWESLAQKVWKISTQLWVDTLPALCSLLICLFFVYAIPGLTSSPSSSTFVSVLATFCVCLLAVPFPPLSAFCSLTSPLSFHTHFFFIYLQIIIICWGHFSRKRDTRNVLFVLHSCANFLPFILCQLFCFLR